MTVPSATTSKTPRAPGSSSASMPSSREIEAASLAAWGL